MTGIMIVENIYNLDYEYQKKLGGNKNDFPIEQIEDDIYFVFATSKSEEGVEYPQELQREKFILKFK